MLINISNHPSKYWGERQLYMATELWGGVTDIPFPQVDPAWDKSAVIAIADDIVDELHSIYLRHSTPSAFHIMGESVLCFHLISRLKAKGCCVVASTSNRNVEYNNDNKISHFEFVTFREY